MRPLTIFGTYRSAGLIICQSLSLYHLRQQVICKKEGNCTPDVVFSATRLLDLSHYYL
jgi:hypothetical protein